MDEICPDCGRLVNKLDSITGFCSECSPTVTDRTSLELYLTVNADEIEHYLLQGCTLNQSIDALHKNGRPRCLGCGKVIRRAKRNAVFCRQTSLCRKLSRRYVYLYQQKSMTKVEALAKVLNDSM